MATARRRLDVALVEQGIAESRSEAGRLIEDRRVRVNGAIAEKASRQVAAGDQLHLVGPPPQFVGRGAHKLEHALDEFGVDPSGLVVLDAGASTGGFTDSVLQRGAAHVYAVDVGHGQLHERLVADERVTNIERTNIRFIESALFDRPIELIVGDLSFISLRMVIDPLLSVIEPGGQLILLVKPQFEAGRAEVSRGGGVVRDDQVRERVRDEIDAAARAAGCTVLGWTESPIAGADGNREYLMHAQAPTTHHPTRAAKNDEANRDEANRDDAKNGKATSDDE